PDNVVALERFDWQPKELIAVLGEHRLRHWGTATHLSFSNKGKDLLSIGSDLIIRVWDPVQGHERASYPLAKNWVLPLTVGNGGKQVISSSVDNTLRLWDVASGKELMTFKGHQDRVITLIMSLDGKTAVSTSMDGTIRIWDTATGAERRNIKRDQN